ncbi:hypothetical protein QUA47_27195 [Microcoleus sp. MON2_D5]
MTEEIKGDRTRLLYFLAAGDRPHPQRSHVKTLQGRSGTSIAPIEAKIEQQPKINLWDSLTRFAANLSISSNGWTIPAIRVRASQLGLTQGLRRI